ncbi:general substrate transporter [Lipomyces chichibuensis]|uniref:general substrate transporter n=1 Tax=Lipomyces chichibuensis TaxID=1546026 RepID=UPI00334355EE
MVRLLNVYTISLLASLGGLLYGFEISSMSGVINTDQYKNYFGNPLGTLQGGITSAMAAGSIVGAIFAGVLGDWLSRKVTIQVGAVLWCVGSAVQSLTNGIGMLVVGRVLSGICVGLTSTLVPIYQSEIAPRKIRGRVVSLQQLALTSGILIQYSIQYGCSFIQSQAAFRLPWAIQAIPAIFLFISLFWLPFSPRWLASKDRWDDALKVLAFLRTANNDINDPLVLAEYRSIEDQVRIERETESRSFKELVSKKLRKRVFLSVAVHVCNQLTGSNLLDYYILYIYRSVGVSNLAVAAFYQYVIKVVMTVPALLWSDKWGRRPFLIVGGITMAICFFVVSGLYGGYGEPNPVMNQPYTSLIINHSDVTRLIQAFCYIAIGAFNLSWAPIPWMYSVEVVPLRIRAKTVSVALTCRWTINFAVAFAILPLFHATTWGVFVMFGLFNLAISILFFFLAPETKQRTLEEIDEIFEHGQPLAMSFSPRRRQIGAKWWHWLLKGGVLCDDHRHARQEDVDIVDERNG